MQFRNTGRESTRHPSRSKITARRIARARYPPLVSEPLTVAAAAELLNVTPRTILNWIQSGRIPHLQSGGAAPVYRIPLHALVATLGENRALAAELVDEHVRGGYG